MSQATPPHRSRVPWALAATVGLCSGLVGYVIHAARVNRIPKQVVQVERLTDMPGREETPAISPDGKAVAFVAAVGGKRQIWVIQLAGGPPRAITKDDADHYGPRWSADSNSLIYLASYLGSNAIWEIPVAGGMARMLVDAVAPGDLSHDGKSLAFFRLRDGSAELTIAARDGSNPHIVTKAPGVGIYSNLRWDPGDKKLAYQEGRNLLVTGISGGESVRAAVGDAPVAGFAWAPDNAGLIVSSSRDTSGPLVYNLWLIPRKEGSSPSQLTFGELSYATPDISRPGGGLVVSRTFVPPSGSMAEADIVMFTGLKW
jgi:Tol biopolymer transport system component